MKLIIGLVIGAVVGLVVGIVGLGGGATPGGDTEATATAAPAEAAVRWKMASSFGSQWPIQGDLGMLLVDKVEAISGGDLTIQFFEPGALVPALEIFDAVSSGAIDAG